jgi:putative Holliday junction resolvase
VRTLGIDVGRRRIGLAISDATGTLARPLGTVTVVRAEGHELVAREIYRLEAEEDGLGAIVVGRPARLDGSATETTAYVDGFVAALQRLTSIPIAQVDERLTSVEAEARLAIEERDWRKRKARLDAAAAAVLLQDYLDGRRT